MERRDRGLHRNVRGFLHREDGSIVVFALFVFVAMVIAGGMAVDLLRAEDQRTRLQATLDRAVLAAADLDQTGDTEAITEIVYDYFRREGLADHLVDVRVKPDIAGRTVGASASFRLDTFFLRMVGVDEVSSGVAGVAQEFIPNREISLVIDISGSMRWDDRMTRLKPAAKTFVKTVLDPTENARVSINVIPYAGQVNPGPEMFDYLGGVRQGGGNYFEEWPQDISNIVTYFDTDDDGLIDIMAKVEDFPDAGQPGHISNDADAFFSQMVEGIVESAGGVLDGASVIGASIKGGVQSDAYFAIADNSNGDAPDIGPTWNTGGAPKGITEIDTLSYGELDLTGPLVGGSCLELGQGDFDGTGLPAAGSYAQTPLFMKWAIAADVMDWGWCPQDDTAIQYAQNDLETIGDYIDALRMHDGTGTHYAMKYALALLDPSSLPALAHLGAQGLVPDDYSGVRPAAWHADQTAKFIVLMTDGQITDQYRPKDPTTPLNATVELDRQSGSVTNTLSGRADNLANFYATCQAAKDKGVTIFTIAYEAPADAKTEMRTCATSESHFFDANTSNIASVYSAIAGKINALRLIH
ncbi:hypothetical protein RGUI_2641 [Rhodovulum sp. P5]|uniref:TadE/TadG family type IV pilus assembly protein n=1 Tax=Rhodovulum sp. P5 TaxID=1564506 RepID=UPI0009C3736A|nr:TadE/TadG family type IV pilus assembly protein [Rhodovulum sp. P5]ARE40782.1 hypothetical protein RGUI_2641 [Rhodovulum sp. P5]